MGEGWKMNVPFSVEYVENLYLIWRETNVGGVPLLM